MTMYDEKSGNPGDPQKPAMGEEKEELLIKHHHFTLKKIVSNRHRSPDGFWYVQGDDEWVMLTSGSAEIGFSDGSSQKMSAGDYLFLPAGVEHRIESTTEDATWIALYYKKDSL